MVRSFSSSLRRKLKIHPVDALLDGPLAYRKVSSRGRRNFKRAWLRDAGNTRAIVEAWFRQRERDLADLVCG